MTDKAQSGQKWYHAVLIAVLVALLAGGTSPWWIGELKVLFGKDIVSDVEEVPATGVLASTSPEQPADNSSQFPDAENPSSGKARLAGRSDEPDSSNDNLGFEEVAQDILYDSRRDRWWTKHENGLVYSFDEANELCAQKGDGKWMLPDRQELDSLIDNRRKAEPGEPRVSPLFVLRGRNFFWSRSMSEADDKTVVLVNLNRPLHDPFNPERYQEVFSTMGTSVDGTIFPADVLCIRYSQPSEAE